jgi:divalent metal cation (Fe/Co/Zn/Cd) transporter
MADPVVLTPGQRQREAALLLAAILDGFIGLLLLVVGLAAGSLTCLAESMRGNMMWTIDLVSLAVIRGVHRRRLRGFEFGTGKIEQLCAAAIACGLLAGAAWIGYDALRLIAAGQSTASPVGLSLAAVVGAINVFINFVAWEKIRQAARGRPSAIMDAQNRARRARLLSSVVVQVTMTAAALAKDPLVVAWLDAGGALLVCAIMFRAAGTLLREAAPDLLDRSTGHLVGPLLDRAVRELPDTFGLEGFRSRGTARAFTLEVTLDCPGTTEIEALRAAGRAIGQALARALPDSEINLAVNTVSIVVEAQRA